jgi:hypothetical protein
MASPSHTSITAAQCRAARALLDMTTAQLSGAAVIPRVVIEEFKAGGAPLSVADLAAMRRAFEAAGVIFVEGDGLGPGVRVRS